MEKIPYIVKKRMRLEGIRGPRQSPLWHRGGGRGRYDHIQGRGRVRHTSRNAHLYLARNDDGRGLERGALTTAITKRLEKRDKGYQDRWDLVWEDETSQKYRHPDHEDHFLWGHAFYEAPVEDLQHIADLIGARR